MSDRFSELANEIDNVMTDEQVDRVLEKLNKIQHEYENTKPEHVPALSRLDTGTDAIVEDALVNGHIESVHTRDAQGMMRIELSIVVPDQSGAVRNFNQYERR